MAIEAIDLRRGQAVQYKGGLWVCINNEKIAKGKGRSYQSVKLKNIQSGQLIEERFRTQDTFEQVHLDRKQMEYLYSDGTSHIVMDGDTFEQVALPAELIGNDKVYLTENIVLEVGFVDGKAITCELPNTVELKVVDTPPQVRGATATNQLKEAEMEGGARVKVPPFVENGETIKVDTRTGEYLGRA
jgi:elongation factor P